MSINRDIFKEAIEKFIREDQNFIAKVQSSIYTPELDVTQNDLKIIDNRLKLLTGLVIFMLTKLSEKEQSESQKKITILS